MIAVDTQDAIWEEKNVKEDSGETSQWGENINVFGLSASKIAALKTLWELRSLKDNWDTYGSAAPTDETILIGETILILSPEEKLPSLQISPVSGGGIQFFWRVGPRELDLEIVPDGTIEYLKSEGEDTEEGEFITFSRAPIPNLLDWVAET